MMQQPQGSTGQPRTGDSTYTGPTVSVTLYVGEFEFDPVFRVWFSAAASFGGPLGSKLGKVFDTFDKDYKRYNSTLRVWQFDFRIYEAFVSKLHSTECKFVALCELPKFIHRGIGKFIMRHERTITNEPTLNLEGSLLDQLLPFQLEGIKFVVKRRGRAMLCDEMGCGKTIQAIGIMQHYRDKWYVALTLYVLIFLVFVILAMAPYIILKKSRHVGIP
jgi:hypothetical protein